MNYILWVGAPHFIFLTLNPLHEISSFDLKKQPELIVTHPEKWNSITLIYVPRQGEWVLLLPSTIAAPWREPHIREWWGKTVQNRGEKFYFSNALTPGMAAVLEHLMNCGHIKTSHIKRWTKELFLWYSKLFASSKIMGGNLLFSGLFGTVGQRKIHNWVICQSRKH